MPAHAFSRAFVPALSALALGVAASKVKKQPLI